MARRGQIEKVKDIPPSWRLKHGADDKLVPRPPEPMDDSNEELSTADGNEVVYDSLPGVFTALNKFMARDFDHLHENAVI